MKEIIRKRATCRLCESNNVEMVVPLEPVPVAEKYLTENELNEDTDLYPIDLYFCRDCSHVQIFDCIDASLVYDDFTFRSGQAQIIVDHFHEVAEKVVVKYKIEHGELVVDIGSNDGTLLQGFKKQGMNVLGVDAVETIAKEAINAGIPTINDFLSSRLTQKINETHGKAKIVCCFNAFAHNDQLNDLASSIRDLMAPDGIFIFEVQYLVDIIDDMVLGAVHHEHVSHHSVKPMQQFLDRKGMELLNVEQNHYQGGSFIGVAQLKGGPRKVDESVEQHVDYEVKRGFDRPGIIKNFSKRLLSLRTELASLIKKWQEEGAIIAGYGATRSGPTLIAQFKCGKDISYIVDDHPQKVNRYTPGDKIKVLPTKELYLRMPKYTIILAWVHANKIIFDNLEYLKKGGHFVLCCPEVKVIDAQNWEETTNELSAKEESLDLDNNYRSL
jgi:SAM-dependent methyltransferase